VPKIFFHAGAHKTASSFLQVNLIANRPAFVEQGWGVSYLKSQKPVILHITKTRTGQPSPEENKKAFNKYFRKIRKRSRNTLITNEGIIGPNNLLLSKGRLYPRRMKMLKILRRQLKGCDVTIGYCIRDYASWLESSYSEIIVGGYTCNFQEYLDQIAIKKLSWVPVVADMVEVFGAENVKLWTFEDFKANPEGLFKTVAETVGIDSNPLKMEKSSRINAAIPSHGFELAIAWNKLLNEKTEFKNKRKLRLRRRLRKLLHETESPTKQRLMDEEMRARLMQRYENEIGRMRKRWPHMFLTIPPKSEVEEPAPVAGETLSTEVPATTATAVIP
jgi:hypothetical protein